MWKMKKKLFKRAHEPPTAKRDAVGNIITSKDALKEMYLLLWKLRFNECKGKNSANWTVNNLEMVTKSLKNDKAFDPLGMINELFKNGIAGSDLKRGIVALMNTIKNTFQYPDFLRLSNIFPIYKNKGSKMDLKNERICVPR